MQIDSKIADQIYDALTKAKNVIIFSHRNPDPDTVGSNLALRSILEKKQINVTSACVDEIPKNLQQVPGFKPFVTKADLHEFDLYISLDAGSLDQVRFPCKCPKQSKKVPFVNIDHHPSNSKFGTINLVKASAASATTILYNLFKIWNEPITPNIATWLLFGVYFDTGSFMHSNTNDEVYNIASELMAKGANHQLIIKDLFKNYTLEKLHLWGKAFSNTRVTDKNVIVSGLREKDYEECHATKEDLSGLIYYLGCTQGPNFAALLSEDQDNNVRGSLRTSRDDIDLSEIARELGGGGHKKASGFTIKGKLDKQTHWSISKD